ncbi:hypothetical protein K466DRAFT_613879 [Polyporus arcularius HHB13444]|uniref:Uncharacterized protein n=1 Tax=Polyporus arcularius HHB13444 TaxID=1314778 RepID=A0A5C3NLX2_9APHY|nr:hypothetical protein K466DRAFT_613879 [Polyporus arcularius HHB13444]
MSTWSHPTISRHSPLEFVTNFKPRVPPRLPKPCKLDTEVPQQPRPPRSAIGTGQLPLSIPAGNLSPYKGRAWLFRARFLPASRSARCCRLGQQLSPVHSPALERAL